MDGRDTAPNSGTKYLKRLINFTKEQNYGKLSTIIGRFYAMDRDNRWERIERAYDLLVNGNGEQIEHSLKGVEAFTKKNYEKKIFDEMMEPATLLNPEEGKIQSNDVLIFIDFRSDRMRQIVETFGKKPSFKTEQILSDLGVYQMTEYNKDFNLPVLFPPDYVKNVLSEWIAEKGLKQFHSAETEKYAHVTFFFNGRCEKPFKNETRKLVPSPQVKTYNLKPEMSMDGVKEAVIDAMDLKYDFIMCNFAPPDMVGHTGDYKATLKAVEETDRCVGECVKAAKENGYVMLVTADHGNAEEMIDDRGDPKTSHNCNRVPFALVQPVLENGLKLGLKGDGKSSLRDVAPTVCDLMGLDVPVEMQGRSLLTRE
ncbi:hypothetical protein MHBO_001492 [Bonamia ostreae]|uniref:Metalloenzyme domain-containing protein n=1 Tax=Bonamia ostreae TaxID=126728 RepID=A0ABV2AJ71_9EUKA